MPKRKIRNAVFLLEKQVNEWNGMLMWFGLAELNPVTLDIKLDPTVIINQKNGMW